MMRYFLLISMLFCVLLAKTQERLILNGIEKDSIRFYVGFQKLNEQFNYLQAAQKFSIAKSGGILDRVDIGRLILPVNGGEAKIGEPTNTIFRLHIYSVDSLTGAPGASLIQEPIQVKNRSNPIVQIDLRKYEIEIPGKTFFVGIEWLFNATNQRLQDLSGKIELVPGKSFRRTANVYQPIIGMVYNKKPYSDAWVMTPEGRWKLYTHNMPYMTDLAISAHMTVD